MYLAKPSVVEQHNETLFPRSEYMKPCYVKMIKHKDNTHSLQLHKAACTEIKMGRDWPDGNS